MSVGIQLVVFLVCGLSIASDVLHQCPEPPHIFDLNVTVASELRCNGLPFVQDGCDVELVVTYIPNIVCFSELQLTVKVSGVWFDVTNVVLDNSTTESFLQSLMHNSTFWKGSELVVEMVFGNHSTPNCLTPKISLSLTLHQRKAEKHTGFLECDTRIQVLQSDIKGLPVFKGTKLVSTLVEKICDKENGFECESACLKSPFKCYLPRRGQAGGLIVFKRVLRNAAVDLADMVITIENQDGQPIAYTVEAKSDGWLVNMTPSDGTTDIYMSVQYFGQFGGAKHIVIRKDSYLSFPGNLVKFFFGAVSVFSRQQTGGLSCDNLEKLVTFQDPRLTSSGLWIAPERIDTDSIIENQFSCGVRDLLALDLVTFTAVVMNLENHTIYDIKLDVTFDSNVFVVPNMDFVNVSYGSAIASIGYSFTLSLGQVLVTVDHLAGLQSGSDSLNILLVGVTLQVVDFASIACVSRVTATLKSFFSYVDLVKYEADLSSDKYLIEVNASLADLLIEIDAGGIQVNASRQFGQSIRPIPLHVLSSSFVSFSMLLSIPALLVGPVTVQMPYGITNVTTMNDTASRVNATTVAASVELNSVLNSSLIGVLGSPEGVYNFGPIFVSDGRSSGKVTLLVTLLVCGTGAQKFYGNSSNVVARVQYGISAQYVVDVMIPVVSEPRLDLIADVSPKPPTLLQGGDIINVTIWITSTSNDHSTALDSSLWIGLYQEVQIARVSCFSVGVDVCRHVRNISELNNKLILHSRGVTLFKDVSITWSSLVELNVSLIVLTSSRPGTGLSITAVVTYKAASMLCAEYSAKSFSEMVVHDGFAITTPALVNATISNSKNQLTPKWHLTFLEYFAVDFVVYIPRVRTDLQIVISFPVLESKVDHLEMTVHNISLVHLGHSVRADEILWHSCDAQGLNKAHDAILDDYCFLVSPNVTLLKSIRSGLRYSVTNVVEINLKNIYQDSCSLHFTPFDCGLITIRVLGQVVGSASEHVMQGLHGNLTVEMNYVSSKFGPQVYEDYNVSTVAGTFQVYVLEPDLDITFNSYYSSIAGETICYHLCISQQNKKEMQHEIIPAFDVSIVVPIAPFVVLLDSPAVLANSSAAEMELLVGNSSITAAVAILDRDDWFMLEYCIAILADITQELSFSDAVMVTYYSQPGKRNGRRYEEFEISVLHVSPVTSGFHKCNIPGKTVSAVLLASSE